MKDSEITSQPTGTVLRALKAAAPQTVPVFAGYLVLGIGYGIYVQSLGLPVWMPMLMGTVVYGGSLEFVLASPEVLVVTTPEPTSLTDSYSLLKSLYRNPKFDREYTKISVLSNRVISAAEGRGVYDKLNTVVGQFLEGEITYAGMIPQDSALEKAIRMQKPVSLQAPLSKSARAFEVVAAELLQGESSDAYRSFGLSRLFSGFWKQKNEGVE